MTRMLGCDLTTVCPYLPPQNLMPTTLLSCARGAGSGILSGGKILHCEAPLVPVHHQSVPSVAGPCLGRCETTSVRIDAGMPCSCAVGFPAMFLGCEWRSLLARRGLWSGGGFTTCCSFPPQALRFAFWSTSSFNIPISALLLPSALVVPC